MVNYVGQQLGNYRLTRVIGQGGFADIYLGEHIHLRTRAAIKVLQMRLAENNVEAFLQEARMLAHLVHPHIIRVLDFGLWEMVPFLVMDYAPGGSLRQRYMKGTPLPAGMLFPYMTQAASALQYAHNNKLIHRDIKPENMLIGPNNDILLSDFGLALMAQSSSSLSKKDMSGTVTYMAPEQVQGKARPASDQYSLAIVVYEWLTGSRPFEGSMTEIATQQVLTTPPPLRDRVSTVSKEVEQVVLKALSKNPLQRFTSVQEFVQVLQQACLFDNRHATTSIRTYPEPKSPFENTAFIPGHTGIVRRVAPIPQPPTGIKTAQAQRYPTSGTSPLSTPSKISQSTGHWPATPRGETLSMQARAMGYNQIIPMSEGLRLSTEHRAALQAKSPLTQSITFPDQNLPSQFVGQAQQQNISRKSSLSPTTISIGRIQAKKPVFTGTTWVIISLLFLVLLLGGTAAGALHFIQAEKQTTPKSSIQDPLVPTANATNIANSTTNSLYPPTGVTTLTDSLASNQLNWDQGTQCNFVNGSYQATIPTNKTATCFAHGTDYQNFIYQVQMTFVKMGHQFSSGGIAFRGNNTSGITYYIEIFESGKFSFIVRPGDGTQKVLAGYPQDTQSIPSFDTTLGQTNTLAIVANKNEFTFYVNKQLVFGPVKDDTATHGMLGIFGAGGQGEDGAEITFSNAQLWAL